MKSAFKGLKVWKCNHAKMLVKMLPKIPALKAQ